MLTKYAILMTKDYGDEHFGKEMLSCGRRVLIFSERREADTALKKFKHWLKKSRYLDSKGDKVSAVALILVLVAPDGQLFVPLSLVLE